MLTGVFLRAFADSILMFSFLPGPGPVDIKLRSVSGPFPAALEHSPREIKSPQQLANIYVSLPCYYESNVNTTRSSRQYFLSLAGVAFVRPFL